MSNRGEIVNVNAVKFVRLLPGPIERVWTYLTECKKLNTWFGEDGKIEPRVGGNVWFMDGHIRGVVTQWKPQKQLSYTWNVFAPGDSESNYPESYLDLTLEQKGEEVRLTLFHLPVPQSFVLQTQMGWHTFLDLIEAGVRGKPQVARETYMQNNAKLYGVDLDNLAH